MASPIISSLKDLEKVIDVMRDKGVANLHIEGIAITMHPQGLAEAAAERDRGRSPAEPKSKVRDDEDEPPLVINGEEVDEDLLLASSSTGPRSR